MILRSSQILRSPQPLATVEPLPLARRLHQLRIRVCNRVECVTTCALVIVLIAGLPIMLVMHLRGYKFAFDDLLVFGMGNLSLFRMTIE